MKKLMMFFGGLLLLATMGGMVFVAAAIYDSGEKQIVEPFFFQPDSLSSRRIGRPITPEELGVDIVRRRLIRRFVSEYFRVYPDVEDVKHRSDVMGALRRMSSNAVFAEWQDGPAQEIQQMAEKKMLRLVKWPDTPNNENIIKRPGSDYWEVHYELHTWDTPNDLSKSPTITPGVVFLQILEESGIPEGIIEDFGVHNFLDDGGDPAALFKFMVTSIAG